MFKFSNKSTRTVLLTCSETLIKMSYRDILCLMYDVRCLMYSRHLPRCLFHRTFQSLKKCYECLQDPANIYLFKVNNRNTRKSCQICSKLAIRAPERRYWHYLSVFVVYIWSSTIVHWKSGQKNSLPMWHLIFWSFL